MEKPNQSRQIKVALYTRVSTEDQAREGYSLSIQRDYLLEFAKRQGWQIHFSDGKSKIYQDDGFSGYSLDRPALNQLVADAHARKFDLVLVYKLDRFSRRLKDFLNLLDEFENLNVEFKSATEPYDTTTSSGKLMLQQLGSFAEFERNRIIERVFPGMVRGVKDGNWQGARYSPFGYRYNKIKKRLEVVKKEVEIVEEIFTKYLGGLSTQKIAGELFRKGIKTRSNGPFSSSLVRKILRNKLYIGKLVWNAHHYDRKQKTAHGYRFVKNDPSQVIEAKGKHKAIISEEVFQQAQRMLDRNRRGSFIRHRKNHYPLSGLLTCGYCKCPLNGAYNMKNHMTGEKTRYYRCAGRSRHDLKCGNGDVKADLIEAQVFEILETLFATDTISAARLKNLVIEKGRESASHEVRKELEALKRDLQQCALRSSKLTDAYLDGTISQEIFQEKNRQIRSKEGDLRIKIERKELQLIEKEESQEYIRQAEAIVKSSCAFKEALDPVTKKELLSLVYRRIIVVDRRLKEVELYQPFDALYKTAHAGAGSVQAERRYINWTKIASKGFLRSPKSYPYLLGPTDAR